MEPDRQRRAGAHARRDHRRALPDHARHDAAHRPRLRQRTKTARRASDGIVMLGYALWQRRFGGDPGVIGRTIRLSRVPYTVVGVLPPGFRGLTGEARGLDSADDDARRGSRIRGGQHSYYAWWRGGSPASPTSSARERRRVDRAADRRGIPDSRGRVTKCGAMAVVAPRLARRSADPPVRARAARRGRLRAADRLRQPRQPDARARRDAAARSRNPARDGRDAQDGWCASS